MSYFMDFYRYDEFENNAGENIGNLYSEYFFNDNLIKRHLEMRIFTQYDRETLAMELFKQRLAMLVASSKSQLETIQKLGWNVTFQKLSFTNNSQSSYEPVPQTIKKKNRRQKGSKSIHPYKPRQKNKLVKSVDSNIKLIAQTTKNNAFSKPSEIIMSDDYMYDELEQHL